MKRKLLLLSAIVPLLLTSCEKEDSYFKQFSVSNIISDTGRVRVVDSIYGTVSPLILKFFFNFIHRQVMRLHFHKILIF